MSTDASPQRIAIFGHQRAALEVAGYLQSREYRILIVGDDEEDLAKARSLGYETTQLDYRDDTELGKMGLGKDLGTVFSLFSDDAENVFLIISIRALAPAVRVLSIAHDSDSVPKLHAAGADKVIDFHEINGRRIWGLLKHPRITEVLESTLFGETGLNLAELMVRAGCFLDGQPINSLNLDDDYGLILIGAVDADMAEQFIVTTEGPGHRLGSGDTLLVIGHNDGIKQLRGDIDRGDHPG